MTDLIDRQAAIEIAIEAADEWDGGYSPEREGIIREFFDKVPAVQSDHVAESDKKVSISCAHENDLISRKAAIEALARMMPRSYTPDGSHPADEEIFRAQEVFADCIEALEILPSAQPDHNADIGKKVSISCGQENDLISRQMAIHAALEDVSGKRTHEFNAGATRAANRIKRLPSAQPEPYWIPCSERLPETYGAYLVQDVCGTIFVDYWRGDWLAKTTMVAWMPLPDPYRGGEE